MNNNTILKKITIAGKLKHFEIKEAFELGGLTFSSSQIKAFMAGSQNKNYVKLTEKEFEGFLDGFIIYSRGQVDETSLLPRFIESFIIDLVESNNNDAIDEIRCLIEDARDEVNESTQQEELGSSQ